MTDEKPRVIIIPPKPELQQTTTVAKQLRVAAYCRVSTKEEEQASSYEAQCEYYTDKIMSNKEWTMAGIFADEGITGTVDVSELMGSSVHLHVTSMGRDVVMVVSTMNMTTAEVSALSHGNTVKYNFPGHVCHLFSKETGLNLEG